MVKDDVSGLSSLGSKETKYKYEGPDVDILETFPNKYLERDYVVEFVFPEFTSLCPKTGQPDFGKITVNYTPDEKCLETKSLKLYFFAFRSHGSFMETIVNKVLEDCVAVCSPRYMTVIGEFNSRGGVAITVEATYFKE